MTNKLLFILLLLISKPAISTAQDIPIGTWRDHLPYSDAVSVSYGDGIIYCATNSAVFLYDKSDMTIDRLNLVNGLSDIGLSKIKYNSYNKKTIIAYTNGNIDILDGNKNITNLSFIKNSNIAGSKTINHIHIVGKLAYLSTDFGIVVLDTDKLEIIDTYLFGPLGSFIVTNAITIDNTNIYAATNQGVFFANKNSANLIDYNSWSLLPDLGTLSYSNIVFYANKLFTISESSTLNGDTLLYKNAGVWQKFIPNGNNYNSITLSSNYLFINYDNKVEKYDTSLTVLTFATHYKNLFGIKPLETTIDNEGYMLIAEKSHGVLRIKDSFNGSIIMPNGPSSINAYSMDFFNDELWVTSGGFNNSDFNPSGVSKHLISYRKDGTWNSLGEKINTIEGVTATDAVSIAINPSNKSQVFFGTWDDGLFEVNNEIITNILTAQNSALDSTFFGSTKIGGLVFDKDNNLWAVNSFANNQISVKTPDNSWYPYTMSALGFSSSNVFTNIIVTQDDNKWVMEPRANSIVVIKSGVVDGLSLDATALSSADNDIPGTRLYSITEDLDGEIWIGTDEGVAVFYNPSNVFDENIKAERVYLQQDGQTQILLETEIINTITVDGANRKWIGTQNSGAFLMDEDGTEQIEHFTTENSPLFSNTIFDIIINPKTGEVFFATEKGIISYKGTATDADSDFNNVFVYPNPVKPDFTGTIAIRGLVKDTDVRITDISGNIVYQTTSLGGQAIWDGKDFNGNKVQTGVYMIFNGSPEGGLKAVAKILFIH